MNQGFASARYQSRNAALSGENVVSRANSVLAIALLAAIALAPLPLGSVRPAHWGVWTVFLGLAGLVYFGVLMMGGHRLRITPRHFLPAVVMMGLTWAALVVQLLPIGTFSIPLAGQEPLTTAQVSIAPDLTLLMLTRQLTYGLFVLLMLQTAVNDDRRSRMLHVLCLVVVGYGAYGIFALQAGDTILGMEKWAYFGSATGPFVNRNSFATFLGLGAIIALALGCAMIVRQAQRSRDDGRIHNLYSGVLLYGLAYLFLLSVVVATQSRMGLMATLAGSLVVILIMLASAGRARLWLVALPALIAMIALALYLFGDGLLERIGGFDRSSSDRQLLYQQVFDLISLRPWIGFGGGTFELAFPLAHQPSLSPDLVWSRAHSTYLTLWSELGYIFGSLPILAIAYLGLKMLGGLIRQTGSWTAQTAGLGAIVVGGVHSLVDFSLEIPAVALLMLALVAIGAATAPKASGGRR